MPAWRKGGVLVTKLITAYPGNAARDLPAISGVVAVFDAETGAMLMVIDGGRSPHAGQLPPPLLPQAE